MKIALAQLNLTIGDFDGNLAALCQAAQKAVVSRADLIVFSELAITAYYPGDLLREADFLNRVQDTLEKFLTASKAWPDLLCAVGLPLRHDNPGKGLYNGMVLVKNGQVIFSYAKQLLPTYEVFQERRHFDPGPDELATITVKGQRLAFLICEDIWNDDGRGYDHNPLLRVQEQHVDLLVTLNASPSHVGKREFRHRLFSDISRRREIAMVYVNQVGGHDQLIYDGASFAAEPERGIVFEAARFEEELAILTFEQGRFTDVAGEALAHVNLEGLSTCAFYEAQLNRGLKDYARRCGFRKVVIGSSGGIDSALTIALAAKALGPDAVTAITMPSAISSAGSLQDSKILCDGLGVRLYVHPIAELVTAFQSTYTASLGQPLAGLALENIQARIRGVILMAYANQEGALLLTTGNKSEIAVGYCTLYGDTNGGLNLIGDLYKTEVFALCAYLNQTYQPTQIPQTIMDKPPSAELAPDQKDSDSLPPYPVLDSVLKWLIEGERCLAQAEWNQVNAFIQELQSTEQGLALIEQVRGLIRRSEYKRQQSAPILRLRARAFGAGRQVPITASY